MFGLSVRWSLTGAPAGTLERLHAYVEDVSLSRFAGLDGLRYKTWRARDGEWFEGTYVFVSEQARAEFQAAFTASADVAAGSEIIGSGPELIEAFEVVAAVRGPAGFRSSARFES
ncbi:MAG: hypothetical protein P1U38_11540 [Aeromicrobium sp.]|uniref:hypothetical protein n=1 Tax=Aeromicrobium sp. TaxID=1871063 RepID=UPI0025B8FD4A|nr:hypothetical protein [Aeromicrobium sp.]MCK5891945.1 hypothetical protein [Aeromicrobium sp.]MDF1705398.1 hypothetical protein [Aeromicrobium sp.]